MLIGCILKDKHFLTESILNPIDKMNFDLVEKLTDEKVRTLLHEHIKGSERTVSFLKMSRNILDAFLCKELSLEDRVYKM